MAVDSSASYGMHRFGIEDEGWFEAARTELERRGFKLRLQPRSIIIDKNQRLPRIVGCAREFLEFAERQGIRIDAAAFEAADRYGDGRSDLAGRTTNSPFETPSDRPEPDHVSRAPELAVPAEFGRAEARAVEQRLEELRLEKDRLAAERRAAQTLASEKRQLQQHCALLEAEVARLSAIAGQAVKQRDLWQMSASSAEDRLRVLQAELDGPSDETGPDRKFNQLRRFLARELHPDLAAADGPERAVREALFKRVWADRPAQDERTMNCRRHRRVPREGAATRASTGLRDRTSRTLSMTLGT